MRVMTSVEQKNRLRVNGKKAIRIAQKLIEENKALRQNVNTSQNTAVESMKAQAESNLVMVRKKLKEAQENYDTDALIAAQEELAEAEV
jgi:predicted translin family RNA/ssDNA-binding protein